jgi:hypothetical protein
MQIFQQEYDDGIADTIKSTAKISYASLIEPSKNYLLSKSRNNIKGLASIDDSDLYYVQSILVTSNWNKNDDIFDKNEIWIARNTPEDKPTNLEHDEGTIIGHITSNWPITSDGVLIDENTPTENLPEKFHILTGSVIYRAFSNPELKERAEKLISEIENGQKYVSMECLFKGFDYGLLDKENGQYKILARDNNTAYLTKYLRSYGGSGEHEQYKIGRVLRNITFSGKGFVDKPANPESIIFNKNEFTKLQKTEEQTQIDKIESEKKVNFSISGVSNIDLKPEVETITMNLENEIAEIKTKIEALATSASQKSDCSEAVKDAYASVKTAEAVVLDLNNTLKANEEALTQTRAEIESLRLEKEEAAKKMKEEMAMKEEDMKKMKAELDSALETIAAYKDKEEKMMKAEKKMKRMATLIENGVDSEMASSTVDKFENLDDEAFEAISTLIATKKIVSEETEEAMMKKKAEKIKEEEEAMMMKKKASEENANPEVLEAVEVAEEVNLGIGGETDNSVEATRAALVEFVSSRLGKKL